MTVKTNMGISKELIIEELEKTNKLFLKYRDGFSILMEYFDSIPDEEKPKVFKQLRKIGL